MWTLLLQIPGILDDLIVELEQAIVRFEWNANDSFNPSKWHLNLLQFSKMLFEGD